MSLDAFVRCTCIRDGKAKPHPQPLPDRLPFDESGEPTLTADPTQEEWEAHDQWIGESCEHEGYLLSVFLGNITRVGNLRSFPRGLQGSPGPKFPTLPEKVLCHGAHTGDWGFSKDAAKLLNEVDIVLHSSDILADSEKEFFTNMKLLSEAVWRPAIRLCFSGFRSALNRVNPRQRSLRQS
ncbi:MAG: hypothetical protein WB762_19430 [Candidatus Sulfotelmatobacter sp.]